MAAFVEWVLEEVLEPVEHRQWVWTIPKASRPAFRRDRKLLGELCRYAWRSLRQYVGSGRGPGSPGAGFAIRTYGDQLNHHPYLHSLVSGMAWHRDGVLSPLHGGDSQVITRLFEHHLLEMLVSRRRLSRDFADKLRCRRHSGFQLYCGPPVGPQDRPALERPAAYMIRPSFATGRLHYEPHQSRVEYRTTKGITCSMDALDRIALVTSHIPAHHEQTLRYPLTTLSLNFASPARVQTLQNPPSPTLLCSSRPEWWKTRSGAARSFTG